MWSHRWLQTHAYNILCAIASEYHLMAREAIEHGITMCRRVAGRFERVSGTDDDLTVVVDYAHTPDAHRTSLQRFGMR
jgi:UDP-N-acetylmuramoyl-L-alanyl-D-glutamate--2,6-diaminopimelate ligase